MQSLQTKALLAGLFFGLWPLCMNRSGLSGNVSSMAFSGLVFLIVAPFAIGELKSVTNVNYGMVILAGIFGAIGVMCFNGMLAKATVQSVGTLFVLMIAVQTAVPAIYQAIMNGNVSFSRGLGFVLTAAAAWLLCRKEG